MAITDKYRNFADLAANETEGKDFRIHTKPRNPDVTIIAPHGGRIEPYTAEIASAVAGDEFNLYVFEANKENLHITSVKFDEPRCLELVRASRVVLAVHGCVNQIEEDQTVYFGGLDTTLIERMKRLLAAESFEVADHPKHKGNHPNNICNRGLARRGVQLELPFFLRKKMVDGSPSSGSQFSKFVFAIRSAISGAITSAS